MTNSFRLIRGMWTLFEPVHAITYFSPEPRAAYEAIGLRGFWRGYFAGRAAPLGAIGAAPVAALFAGFAPAFVARALPAVWSVAAPDVALAARVDGAVATLRRVVPDVSTVERAAAALESVVAGLALAGRPLGAANAALPGREDPYSRVWQAATTLREHRGDGHVAALVAAGVAGLDILVLRCALDLDRALMQPARGWTDEQWDAASEGLQKRGLLAGAVITDAGRRVVADVERNTDRAASAAWLLLPAGEIALVAQALVPIARACAAELPAQTPIGVLRVWDVEADPDADSVTAPG